MARATFDIDKEKLEVRLVREYDVKPERLWLAHTDPEQITRWWDENVTVDEMDVRVGGKWRFVSGENGEHVFRGEYTEVDEPHSLTRTFEYEPMAGHVLVETAMFEPLDEDRTRLTVVAKYANLNDLEGMVGMGMEEGSVAGLERLAEVVAEDK